MFIVNKYVVRLKIKRSTIITILETLVVNSCLIDSFFKNWMFQKRPKCRLFPVHNTALVPSTKQIGHFVLLICVFRESYHKNSIGTKLIGIESRYSVIIVITHTLSNRVSFIIHIVTSFGQLLAAPSDLCYLFINGIHASCFCVLCPASSNVLVFVWFMV